MERSVQDAPAKGALSDSPASGICAAPGIGENNIAGQRLFIPISLGNHYYSSNILARVISEFIAVSNKSVIFLCDRLRFLSYEIRGETDVQKISTNIKLQLHQLSRALTNLGLHLHRNTEIVSWSYLERDDRYTRLLSSLDEFISTDPVSLRELERCATELMTRFGNTKQHMPSDKYRLQLQYVLEETALSIYLTEVEGFNTEVYRRGMGFVDFLYNIRSAELMRILNKTVLARKFISLEECFD